MSEDIEKMNRVFTQTEITDKARIESEIEEDLKVIDSSAGRIGERLTEIRDRGLYLIEYDTFEEYGKQRWGKSRAWLYQQMQAHAVIEALPENLSTIVNTESKARALTKVPPKARAKVVREASRNGSVTAKSIEESAQRIIQPKAQKEKPQLLDKTGYPVPDNLVPLFGRAPEVAEVLTRISATRGLLRRVSENKDILWSPVNFSVAMIELDKAFAEMKCALPFAVCPYCQGRSETMTHCNACKGRGVVSEFFYDHAVPTDIKGVREKSCKK